MEPPAGPPPAADFDGGEPEDDARDGVGDDETGSDGSAGLEEPGGDPLRFRNWMHRSATGAVMSGIALGFQQALETRRNPAYVIDAPGEPDDPDSLITLHIDPDDPTNSVAVIRPPRSDSPPAPPGDRDGHEGPVTRSS